MPLFPLTPYCSFSNGNAVTGVLLTQIMHNEFEEYTCINNGILTSEYMEGFTWIP